MRSGGIPARATDALSFVANLDANQEVPTVAFDPLAADSYNSTYTTKLYDSQGKEHTLTQYFVKTGDNSWNAHYYVDGTALAGAPQALTFDSAGVLAAPIGSVALAAPLTGGVAPWPSSSTTAAPASTAPNSASPTTVPPATQLASRPA